MHNQKLKNKIYSNLFLILLIFGIIYFFIVPTYSGGGSVYAPKNSISSLLDQKRGINEAISIAEEYKQRLQTVNNDFLNAENTLPIDLLNTALPHEADPVLIVYELTKIAERPESNMALSSPSYSDTGSTDLSRPYSTITVNFQVEGTYTELKAFLKNLERSKRIYNVVSVVFLSDDSSVSSTINKYSISVETYYLKNS